MMSPHFNDFREFVLQLQSESFPKSLWFQSPDIDVYVRSYSEKYVRMLDESWAGGAALVLANIRVPVNRQRSGVFKQLVSDMMESDLPFKYLKIEQVVTGYFDAHLQRDGWEAMSRPVSLSLSRAGYTGTTDSLIRDPKSYFKTR